MAEVKLWVRVQPNASKNEIVGFSDGILKVKIAAPPVAGKANAELVAFLAKRLGVSRNQITIVSGEKSRNKLIAIEGVTQIEVGDLLQ